MSEEVWFPIENVEKMSVGEDGSTWWSGTVSAEGREVVSKPIIGTAIGYAVNEHGEKRIVIIPMFDSEEGPVRGDPFSMTPVQAGDFMSSVWNAILQANE